MSIKTWEHFFKPEVRTSGRKYFASGNVSISQPSDTETQAYVKTSPPVKITLKSPSMESNLIVADCSCPLSKKGQFCKHIWAVLLATNEKRPDFFEGKFELEKQKLGRTHTENPKAKFTSVSNEAFKAKQNEYRKQQYQKQKERLKAKKKVLKQPLPDYPKDIEAALKFFNQNGFPMENPVKADDVRLARKKLSRIFHPDIGGSHDEILELNKNFEILLAFFSTSNSQ